MLFSNCKTVTDLHPISVSLPTHFGEHLKLFLLFCRYVWERAWLHNWGSAFTWQRKGEFFFSLLHPGTFRISIDNQSATFSPGKVKSSRALGQNIVPHFQLNVLKIKPCVSDRSDRNLSRGCRSGSMWLLKSLACLLSTFVYTGVKWVMSLTDSKEARTCCATRVVLAIVIVALKIFVLRHK